VRQRDVRFGIENYRLREYPRNKTKYWINKLQVKTDILYLEFDRPRYYESKIQDCVVRRSIGEYEGDNSARVFKHQTAL